MHPLFAAMPVAPSHPNVVLLIFYVSTVPSFIFAAIAGRSIGWGIFQAVLLGLGLWQYWRWTDNVTNGIRLIGVYVIYGCLNIAAALIFWLHSTVVHADGGWIWPLAGLALAAAIGVLTTRIIRSFS